jgi:CheY-like chemotaxis protein
LVEDNAINCELAVELLTDLGCVVESAKNGREGVERIFAKPFDLILMDIQMPEMDGLTATELIRADLRFRELPIIAMTANAMTVDKENSLAVGMNDYLVKPIMPEKLTAVLLQWLGNKSPENSLFAKISSQIATTSNFCVPDELPPFNIKIALLRVKNNASLLYKLLQMFVQEYTEFIPNLQKLMQKQDYTEAKIRVHTLKSVAANLEAADLAKAAAAVELAYKSHDLSTLPMLLTTLDQTLTEALQAANSLKNMEISQ